MHDFPSGATSTEPRTYYSACGPQRRFEGISGSSAVNFPQIGSYMARHRTALPVERESPQPFNRSSRFVSSPKSPVPPRPSQLKMSSKVESWPNVSLPV